MAALNDPLACGPESLLRQVAHPKPDWQLSFRVSDAVRRRKVVGARTRGPRGMVYGDLEFGPLWAVIGAAEMRTDLRAERVLFGKRRHCSNTDRPSLAV